MNKLFLTDDGSHSVHSEQFSVNYHSTHGAIQESKHIFIDAGLKHFAQKSPKNDITVLEMGFGTGLNALLTYLAAEQNSWQINYIALEAYPLSKEQFLALNYPEKLEKPESQAVFLKMHEATWNEKHPLSKNVNFTKIKADFKDIDFKNVADVIYFDAFSPESQPELWNETMMQIVYDALREGGVMTTYCAKGSVKRALKSVGFQLESLKGPVGKREISRVTKNNIWNTAKFVTYFPAIDANRFRII